MGDLEGPSDNVVEAQLSSPFFGPIQFNLGVSPKTPKRNNDKRSIAIALSSEEGSAIALASTWAPASSEDIRSKSRPHIPPQIHRSHWPPRLRRGQC